MMGVGGWCCDCPAASHAVLCIHRTTGQVASDRGCGSVGLTATHDALHPSAPALRTSPDCIMMERAAAKPSSLSSVQTAGKGRAARRRVGSGNSVVRCTFSLGGHGGRLAACGCVVAHMTHCLAKDDRNVVVAEGGGGAAVLDQHAFECTCLALLHSLFPPRTPALNTNVLHAILPFLPRTGACTTQLACRAQVQRADDGSATHDGHGRFLKPRGLGGWRLRALHQRPRAVRARGHHFLSVQPDDVLHSAPLQPRSVLASPRVLMACNGADQGWDARWRAPSTVPLAPSVHCALHTCAWRTAKSALPQQYARSSPLSRPLIPDPQPCMQTPPASLASSPPHNRSSPNPNRTHTTCR